MSEGKLPNPLADASKKDPSDDFLAFSMTSTPREEKFQPRRGKQNRQENWQRFGNFERNRSQQNSFSPHTPST